MRRFWAHSITAIAFLVPNMANAAEILPEKVVDAYINICVSFKSDFGDFNRSAKRFGFVKVYRDFYNGVESYSGLVAKRETGVVQGIPYSSCLVSFPLDTELEIVRDLLDAFAIESGFEKKQRSYYVRKNTASADSIELKPLGGSKLWVVKSTHLRF